jgi:hypothetical protein
VEHTLRSSSGPRNGGGWSGSGCTRRAFERRRSALEGERLRRRKRDTLESGGGPGGERQLHWLGDGYSWASCLLSSAG